MDLTKTILDVDKGNVCFENNWYISYVMQNIRKIVRPEEVMKSYDADNPFINYNLDLSIEKDLSHNFEKKPTLKSKLLFMDYRFRNFHPGTLYVTNNSSPAQNSVAITEPIIKVDREYFQVNDRCVPGGTSISRRHCLIINCIDDVWLYNLDGTGTFVNDEWVNG